MKHATSVVLGLAAIVVGFSSASYDPHAPDPSPRSVGRTYNYYPPPPPPPPSKDMEPKTELDKLYSRFENVLNQLKTADEKLEAMTSRLAVQRRVVQDLFRVTFEAFKNNDETQDDSIADLQSRIANAQTEIDEVAAAVSSLSAITNDVAADQTAMKKDIADRQKVDLDNDAALEGLKVRAEWLKQKLLQTIGNDFQLVNQGISATAAKLARVIAFNSRRKCETGKITLDSDDRRAEYLYQQKYSITPEVNFGLCGFNFKIDSGSDKSLGGYGGYNPYGYNPYYRHKPSKQKLEPHAIGLSTSAFSSLTGLNIEMFDTGFGDSTLVTADVCFIACSIGPGAF